MDGKKVTPGLLQQKKDKGEKITVLTAYDYPTAKLAEQAGMDALLVGDSLGMAVQGHETTLPVTLDEMVYHTKIVCRAVERVMVIGDLPFMSYQISPEQAIESAGRLLKEAGAHAVKIEGGEHMAETVARMTDIGIPVVTHVGLTPQSVRKFGGLGRVQGKTESDADRILREAQILEEAGSFMIVLELIPAELARRVTESLTIPTIGIGAGPHCDGQVQIVDDMLGRYTGKQFKHVKKYADLASTMTEAFEHYIHEVQSGDFPGPEHSF